MILLVEDNRDDEQLAVRALQKSSIRKRVTVAHDGAEALELLKQSAEERLPDLVLLDLKLPKLNGFEVLQRIRQEERTRLIPVIVLTASHEDEDLDKAYRLGANSYVRKPVGFAEFTAAVQQMGQYWLSLNEPAPSHKAA